MCNLLQLYKTALRNLGSDLSIDLGLVKSLFSAEYRNSRVLSITLTQGEVDFMLKTSKTPNIFKKLHKRPPERISATNRTRYEEGNTLSHRRNYKGLQQWHKLSDMG